MNLTLFHYHLLPGGVTGVIIKSVLNLLTEEGPWEGITLVSGEEENAGETLNAIKRKCSPETAERVTLQVVPEIGYAQPGEVSLSSEELAEKLLNLFAPPEEKKNIWWVHNYQLGKNPVFTQALLDILKRKVSPPLIFQIHDFPECARFENLKILREGTKGEIYPQHPRLAYGVINGRDQNLLTEAGLPRERVHLLENPVPPETLPSPDPKDLHLRLQKAFGREFPGFNRLSADTPYLLYPIRTIRRKNVLEMMMLSLLTRGEAPLVVTLPGVSDQEAGYSALVEQLWQEIELPGLWGVGRRLDEAGVSFPELIAGSGRVVSSAVQEGFGYLFINALQWRKPLTARCLDILQGMDEIFQGAPVRFYHQTRVPAGRKVCRRTRQAYQDRLALLENQLPPEARAPLAQGFNSLFSSEQTDPFAPKAPGTPESVSPDSAEWIDFSFLSVEDQREFILALTRDSGLRRETEEALQPLLRDLTNREALGEYTPALNSELDRRISRRFGRQAYARQIRRVVDQLTGSSAEEVVPSEEESPRINQVNRELVRLFAHPQYFRLLYQF